MKLIFLDCTKFKKNYSHNMIKKTTWFLGKNIIFKFEKEDFMKKLIIRFILMIFSTSVFAISSCSKNEILDTSYSIIGATPELSSVGESAKFQLNRYIGWLYASSRGNLPNTSISKEEIIEIEKLFNEWQKLSGEEFEKPLLREQAQNIIQKYNRVGCKLRSI